MEDASDRMFSDLIADDELTTSHNPTQYTTGNDPYSRTLDAFDNRRKQIIQEDP